MWCLEKEIGEGPRVLRSLVKSLILCIVKCQILHGPWHMMPSISTVEARSQNRSCVTCSIDLDCHRCRVRDTGTRH